MANMVAFTVGMDRKRMPYQIPEQDVIHASPRFAIMLSNNIYNVLHLGTDEEVAELIVQQLQNQDRIKTALSRLLCTISATT